jgi:hypothetical protein
VASKSEMTKWVRPHAVGTLRVDSRMVSTNQADQARKEIER